MDGRARRLVTCDVSRFVVLYRWKRVAEATYIDKKAIMD